MKFLILDPCPTGYEYRTGSIGGSSTMDNLSISLQECAMVCKEKNDCLSFMYSESNVVCIQNKEREPTAYPIESFVFCSKIGNM